MRNPERKTPPKPPQRVSSLDRKNSSGSNRESVITVIHVNGSATSSREDVASGGFDAVDSGRETSSSATEPTSPRQIGITSPEMDGYDGDSAEKKDNNSFRNKTAINAGGIPSMCVITPPLSDDESVRSSASASETPVASGVAGEDPALGSVAAKALLFQGGSSNNTVHNTVRQVPRIETAKTPTRGEPVLATAAPAANAAQPSPAAAANAAQPPLAAAASQQTKQPVKTLVHSTSVDYSVNIRPSAVKISDMTRRFSGDAAQLPGQQQQQQQIPQVHQPKMQKVPPPPPPREDSIESSRKLESNSLTRGSVVPAVLTSNEVTPATNNTVLIQHQQQPFSAVPLSVKQNLVITPTNSLERKKLKASGAHVTLDSEGKVVYSSDSLPRRRPMGYEAAADPGVVASSSSLPPGITNIQQMPLPPPPVEGAVLLPRAMQQGTTAGIPVLQPVDHSAAAPAAMQQHQQHIQQHLLQQQVLQQQQQALLRQEQEEKLQRQRQEEILLQRAVQHQIDQSKQEVLQQQNALKQQHHELQQQLHETRLELQRQQQEQQQKLQALRERQAYLQSKTPSKGSSSSNDKKQKEHQKQQEKINKEVTKQQQQQQKLQEQQRRQQAIEQQKQMQLIEQQKQIQIQKAQIQQQQLQQQQHQQQFQQQQQQQQHLLQQQQFQQQQAIYGTRQDPYLFPSVPLTGAAVPLAQIPPIVPPPPPANPRMPPDGGIGVIMASTGAPMSPRSQRAGAYVHVQGGGDPLQQQQLQQQLQQQQQLAAVQAASQFPSRPHSAQAMYAPTVAQQMQQQTGSSTPGPTSRAPTPIQGAVTSSPRHTPFLTPASTPQQLQQQLQQQIALQQQSQLRGSAGITATLLLGKASLLAPSNAEFCNNSSDNNLDVSNNVTTNQCPSSQTQTSNVTSNVATNVTSNTSTSTRHEKHFVTVQAQCTDVRLLPYLSSAVSNASSVCSNGDSLVNTSISSPDLLNKENKNSSKHYDKSSNESFLSNIIKSAKSPRLNKRGNKASKNTSTNIDNATKDSDESLNISLGSESYKAGTCVDDIPNTPLGSVVGSATSTSSFTTQRVFAALAHARLGADKILRNTSPSKGSYFNSNGMGSKLSKYDPLRQSINVSPGSLHVQSTSLVTISANAASSLVTTPANAVHTSPVPTYQYVSSPRFGRRWQPKSVVSNLDATTENNIVAIKDRPVLVHDEECVSESCFQRNNSYRLATVQLSEPTISMALVDAKLKRSSRVLGNVPLGRVDYGVFDRPMVNDIPLHGPRIIVQNQYNQNLCGNENFNRHDGMYNSMPRNPIRNRTSSLNSSVPFPVFPVSKNLNRTLSGGFPGAAPGRKSVLSDASQIKRVSNPNQRIQNLTREEVIKKMGLEDKLHPNSSCSVFNNGNGNLNARVTSSNGNVSSSVNGKPSVLNGNQALADPNSSVNETLRRPRVVGSIPKPGASNLSTEIW